MTAPASPSLVQFPSITWDELSCHADGLRQFIISGEFHYFRVPADQWAIRLRQWKAAGGRTIATYVPWLLHEPEEGRFDFGSQPWLQLESFLNLCREEGVSVVARPGPYQYSELKFGGLPAWLFRDYPEILATDPAGKPRSYWSVSYLHPVFLAKVARWFDRIAPLLAAHTSESGGCITMIQFDNELAGVHDWFGGWDYNRTTMGFGQDSGRYPRFLAEKYGSIAALNHRYGTVFGSFAEVAPLEGKTWPDNASRRRVRDYAMFYFGTLAEYAVTLVGMLEQHGLNGPFVHNSASQYMNGFFKETMERLPGRVLLGTDDYYNLNQDWDQNHPTPKYVTKCWYSMETMRLYGCPPVVWEMPGGSCSDWPPITPTDLKACYWMHLAYGVKGFNYYILTGGPNPPQAGTTSDLYDYGAAIGADGSLRPSYEVQREFHAFLAEHSWLVAAHQAIDFRIGLDWELSRAGYYFGGRGDLELSAPEAWNLWRKGVAISAWCGSWSTALADLGADSLLELTDKPLWVCSTASLSCAVQLRLSRFVERGGRLILSPLVPYLDEDFEPCTILRDCLGGAPTRKSSQDAPRLNVGPIRNVFVTEQLFECAAPPAGAEVIAREETTGAIAGWHRRWPGGGTAIWLGLQWKHTQHEHSRMVAWLLGLAQCGGPVLRCDNPNVWATLRTDGHRRMIFLLNCFTAPMEARVELADPETRQYRDLGLHRLAPMEVKAIDAT